MVKETEKPIRPFDLKVSLQKTTAHRVSRWAFFTYEEKGICYLRQRNCLVQISRLFYKFGDKHGKPTGKTASFSSNDGNKIADFYDKHEQLMKAIQRNKKKRRKKKKEG